MTKTILIAGIGNIFHGDDAFGVEVVRALQKRTLPADVQLTDFGIRSYDLAYAIRDNYAAVLFIDAMEQDEPPGTVYSMKLELDGISRQGAVVNGHSMNPARVLQLVETLGGTTSDLYLIGCEPETLQPVGGQLGLSDTVQSAVPKAVELTEKLVQQLLEEHPPNAHVRQPI